MVLSEKEHTLGKLRTMHLRRAGKALMQTSVLTPCWDTHEPLLHVRVEKFCAARAIDTRKNAQRCIEGETDA